MARLNIDALSRELGVSPIPVREALRRLEAEGWVRFQPNVGAIVAPVDATTWEQEMVAAAILEGAATADAAARLRPSDMARLRRLAAEMELVAAAGDPLRFSTLNRRLHAAIVARCANAYLVELLEQTYTRLDRVRSTMFAYLPERSAHSLAEHARLLELLESGDAAEIERYARWHKLQTVEAYKALHQKDQGVRHPGAEQAPVRLARYGAPAPSSTGTEMNSGWSRRRSQEPSGWRRTTWARAPAPSLGGVDVSAMSPLTSVGSGGSGSNRGSWGRTCFQNARIASLPTVCWPGG